MNDYGCHNVERENCSPAFKAGMKKFVRQRQKNFYSMRVKSSGGEFTAAQLGAIQTLAETFGAGKIRLTSRQEISVPFIDEKNLVDAENFCAAHDLQICAVGATLKTVTACQGCKICRSGIIDAPKIAREIERRHVGEVLPAKFLIGVTGCPNNCMKVEANDLGIKGAGGYKIYLCGEELLPIVRDEDTLYKIVDATLKFFGEHANKGERLKNLLARIGNEDFTRNISSE